MLWLLETACFWIPHQAPIVEHWIWWNNLTAAALRNWPRHGAPILLKTLNFQLGPNQMIPQPKSRLLWPKSSQIPSQSQPPRPHHFFPSFYLRQPLLHSSASASSVGPPRLHRNLSPCRRSWRPLALRWPGECVGKPTEMSIWILPSGSNFGISHLHQATQILRLPFLHPTFQVPPCTMKPLCQWQRCAPITL